MSYSSLVENEMRDLQKTIQKQRLPVSEVAEGRLALNSKQCADAVQLIKHAVGAVKQLMGSNTHSDETKAQLNQLHSEFTSTEILLQRWVNVQAQWLMAEKVIGKEILQRGLIKEDKTKFQKIGAEWRKVISQVRDSNVISATIGNKDLVPFLTNTEETLAKVEKAIHDDVERTRLACPRLQLLNLSETIELLSLGTDVHKYTPYLRKMFVGVGALKVNHDNTHITAVVSSSGEHIVFYPPVPIQGCSAEVIINNFAKALQCRMQSLLKEASEECVNVATGVWNLGNNLIENYPAQIVSTGIRQIWTSWVEGALNLPTNTGSPRTALASPRPATSQSTPAQASGSGMASPNARRLSILTAPLSFGTTGVPPKETRDFYNTTASSPQSTTVSRRPSQRVTEYLAASAVSHRRASTRPEYLSASTPSLIAASRRGSVTTGSPTSGGSPGQSRLNTPGFSTPGTPGTHSTSGSHSMRSRVIPHSLYVALMDGPPGTASTGRGSSTVRPGPEEVEQRICNLTATLVSMLHDGPMSPLIKSTVEALITEQTQLQLEYQENLKELKDTDDFGWQRQVRHYWSKEDNKCTVFIGCFPFEYGTELLPHRHRAILGESAHRAFVSVAQALVANKLGTLVGPSGSGKSETLQEFGYILGRWVKPIDCSIQTTMQDLYQLLADLCTTGAFGILDSVNKLDDTVAVKFAAEIVRVFNDIRNKKAETIIQGRRVKLHSTMPGLFGTVTTVNAQGATATTISTAGDKLSLPFHSRIMAPIHAPNPPIPVIPNGLKHTLRPCYVCKPKMDTIIRVRLAAAGFKLLEELTEKVSALFTLCEAQLSARSHYDWGPATVSATLKQAGEVLQSTPSKFEDLLLKQTLWEYLRPRLAAEDRSRFIVILNDIFPSNASEENHYLQLEQSIDSVMQKDDLTTSPQWKAKVMEIYQAKLHHKCVVVVGNSFAGKTTACNTLRQSLTQVLRCEHQEIRFNPRAMTMPQLIGHTDKKGSWVDGLLPTMWKRLNAGVTQLTPRQMGKPNTWIVFDGPIDGEWTTYVLDLIKTGRVLCGDGVYNMREYPMADNVRVLFESDKLAHGDPALLSQTGIINFSEEDLGWEVIFNQLLRNLPINTSFTQLVSSHITPLLTEFVDAAHHYAATVCGLNTTTSPLSKCMVDFFYYLLAICEELNFGGSAISWDTQVSIMQKVFWFSLSWAIGGSLDPAERRMFDGFVRQHVNDLPQADTVFEYNVNSRNGFWVHWNELVVQPKHCPIEDGRSFVATMDTERVSYLINCCMKGNKRNVLVTGPTCSGKTMLVRSILKGMKTGKEIPFYNGITPQQVQSIFVDEVLADHHGILKPRSGCTPIFIDNINRPAPDEFGQKPCHELLRQFLCNQLLLHSAATEEFKRLDQMSVLATSDTVPENRLFTTFASVHLPEATLQSMENVFQRIVAATFVSGKFGEDVCNVADRLAPMTVQLLSELRRDLKGPAPQYLWLLSSLNKMLQGVLACPASYLHSNTNLLATLWWHEGQRTLMDQITSLDDLSLAETTMEKIRGESLSHCNIQPGTVFFNVAAATTTSDYMPMNSITAVRDSISVTNQQYNDQNGTEIVLHDDFLVDLLKILRQLTIPGGHCVAMGTPGSGRRTLARLASMICRNECQAIERGIAGAIQANSQNKFRQTLVEAFRMAASERRVTVLLSEHVPFDWLEDVHCWLASKQVPLLLEYCEEAHDNLHFVLCLPLNHNTECKYNNPVIEKYYNRYPAFFVHCQVLSVTSPNNWSAESLNYFLSKQLDNIQVSNNTDEMDDEEAEQFVQDEAQHRAGMIELLCKVHERLNTTLAKKVSEQTGMSLVFPVGTFQSFIRLFNQLFESSKQVMDRKQSATTVYGGLLDALRFQLETPEPERQETPMTNEDPQDTTQEDEEENKDETPSGQETPEYEQERLQLISHLREIVSDELDRLHNSDNNLGTSETTLIGDTLVSCTYLSYAGQMTVDGRNMLLSETLPELLADAGLKTSVTDFYDVMRVIYGSEETAEEVESEWVASKLPMDIQSCTNALISNTAMRVSLCVDPCGVYNNWIPNLIKGLNVFSWKTSGAVLSTLQGCMAYGKSLLITDIPPVIPALLLPLVEQIKHQGGVIESDNVVLGNGLKYSYNPSFKLFLSTAHTMNELNQDCFGLCEVVNFDLHNTGYVKTHTVGRLMTQDCDELKQDISKVLEMSKAATGELNRNVTHLQAAVAKLDGGGVETTGQERTGGDKAPQFTAERTKEITELLVAVKRSWAENIDKQGVLQESRKRLHGTFREYDVVGARCGVLWDVLKAIEKFEPACGITYDRFTTLIDAASSKVSKGALPSRRAQELEDSVTHTVLSSFLRSMESEETKLLLVFMYCVYIEMNSTNMDIIQYMALLRGYSFYDLIQTAVPTSGLVGTPRDKEDEGNPCGWLPDISWNNVQTLSSNMEQFKSLVESFTKKEKSWRQWWSQWRADQKLPDLDKLNKLERLILSRYLREDRTHAATVYFTRQVLGDKVQGFESETLKDAVKNVVSEATPKMPTIFVLPATMDIVDELSNAIKNSKNNKKKLTDANLGVVTLNNVESDKLAVAQFDQLFVNGGVLIVKDVTMFDSVLLKHIIQKLSTEEPNIDFHVYLTCTTTSVFTKQFLDISVTVSTPVPRGVRNRLLTQYTTINQEAMSSLKTTEWRNAAFGAQMITSLVYERAQCATLGISGFNGHVKPVGGFEDCQALLDFMRWSINNNVKDPTKRAPPVPWPTLRYMLSQVFLGGVVENESGRKLMNAYAEYFLNADVLKPGIHLCHGYSVPLQDDYNGHVQHIQQYPQSDKFETLGLHGNSDLVISDNKACDLYSKLLLSHMNSHEFTYKFHEALRQHNLPHTVVILSSIKSLQEKIPKRFNQQQTDSQLGQLYGDSPIGIFLRREIYALQMFTDDIENTLRHLHHNIKDIGWSNMSADWQKLGNMLLLSVVPPEWEQNGWGSNNVNEWFKRLQERFEHLSSWLNSKPNTVWLGGFTRPADFIVAMKQETVRAHIGEEDWSYDKLRLKTEVTSDMATNIKRPPLEGVYIRGLHSYGFEFSKWDGKVFECNDMLVEWKGSNTTPMPLLHFTVVQSTIFKNLQPAEYFACPMYTSPRRDTHICDITLECDEHPLHWNLRSAALYTSPGGM